MEDNVFNACYQRWQADKTPFWNDLASKFGYKNGEVLRSKFRRELKKRGIKSKTMQNNSYNESVEIKTNGETVSDKLISICEQDLKNPEKLLLAHGFDPELWVIVSARNNLWHAQRPQDAGRLILYQSRIVVRPKTINDISFSDVIKILSDGKKFQSIIDSISLQSQTTNDSGYVLEIDICDVHFGSDANHSPELLLEKAISDIIFRANKIKISKIYLSIIGDIFHFDTANYTTTSGTPVGTNGLTPYQIFDAAIASFSKILINLANIAPVEIIFIPGNHDQNTSYYLIKTLEGMFSDKLVFDTSHKSRKYRAIGVVLVGWMHGDIDKSRANQWLQVEARELWGKTKFSEIHAGHYHSQSVKEDGGTILRYLPSLSRTDKWHYDKGYVGAINAVTSFLYDLDKGITDIWYSIV